MYYNHHRHISFFFTFFFRFSHLLSPELPALSFPCLFRSGISLITSNFLLKILVEAYSISRFIFYYFYSSSVHLASSLFGLVLDRIQTQTTSSPSSKALTLVSLGLGSAYSRTHSTHPSPQHLPYHPSLFFIIQLSAVLVPTDRTSAIPH